MAPALLVVAGSGRSGTSLFSGLTHRLGLHIPQPEVSANRTNPRGFGEPQWAVDFDRRLLRAAEVRLADARPEAWRISAEVANQPPFRQELRTWLSQQFDEADRVVVKDPHLTWLIDLYREVSYELSADFAVATMVRNPIENVVSRQLAYGDASSSTSRLAGWLNVMLHVELHTRGVPRAFVKFEDLLADWQSALARVERHVGLGLLSGAGPLQLEAAADLVDPRLYRAADSRHGLDVPDRLLDLADQTWAKLKEVAEDSGDEQTIRAELDDLRARYVQLYDESASIAQSSVAAARAAARRQRSARERERSEDQPSHSRWTGARRSVHRAARRSRSILRAAKVEIVARTPLLPVRSRGDRVYLLIFSIDGTGGVARTFCTLANALVERYQVEIISLFRYRTRPHFAIDDRVRVSYLADLRVSDGAAGTPRHLYPRDNPRRSAAERRLDARPSTLRPRATPYSALTDRLLRRKLGNLAPGVLLSDRPTMHAAAATFTPSRVIRIATEHSSFDHRMPQFRKLLAAHSHRYDALVTLNDIDRRAYEEFLGPTTRVVAIPNAVNLPAATATPASSKVILACGSLGANKGFDRVIEAFAPLAGQYPDWRLHIYGRGAERRALSALIGTHGLEKSVQLKGFDSDLSEAYKTAALFVAGSHHEAFGLALAEAMSWGVPAVSFDSGCGPRHLITDGDNGFLVPDGDLGRFTDTVHALIEDPELRQRLGSRARETMQQYQPENVLGQWESLIRAVRAERSRRRFSRFLR